VDGGGEVFFVLDGATPGVDGGAVVGLQFV
jgi:hypothetical protein